MKPKSIKFVCMTIQEARNKLMFQLYHYYENNEAANISDLVMEKLTGWKRIDRVTNREVKLSAHMESQLDEYISHLASHRPVQYVLNEAWFYGLKLYVDERVLIPRPETEELVEWVLKSESGNATINILDVGTGSGCIPIAIKKNLTSSNVFACDVSEGALEVAVRNAATHHVEIRFLNLDILKDESLEALPEFDVIISNPPYIPLAEKQKMPDHVTKFEPPLALFVEDADPLLFYKAIARTGKSKLTRHGSVYVEVHEDLASATAKVFEGEGYSNVEVRKDMQGKERMIKATL